MHVLEQFDINVRAQCTRHASMCTHTQEDTLRVLSKFMQLIMKENIIHGCFRYKVYEEINRQNLIVVYFKSILCNVLQYACNYFDNVQTGTTNAAELPGGFSWNQSLCPQFPSGRFRFTKSQHFLLRSLPKSDVFLMSASQIH